MEEHRNIILADHKPTLNKQTMNYPILKQNTQQTGVLSIPYATFKLKIFGAHCKSLDIFYHIISIF